MKKKGATKDEIRQMEGLTKEKAFPMVDLEFRIVVPKPEMGGLELSEPKKRKKQQRAAVVEVRKQKNNKPIF